MAFPDEPQGTPVPRVTYAAHDAASKSRSELQCPVLKHVAGEVLTERSAHTKYDETQSYSDSWSSSYTDRAQYRYPDPASRRRRLCCLRREAAANRPASAAIRPDPEEEEEGMARMSFLEHLEELRTRIISALMGMGVAFVVCLMLGPQLWDIIRRPAHNGARDI